MRDHHSRVVAIVPAWNESDSIVSVLDAITAMTKVPDEIVVIDGQSNDGTPDRVREWAAESKAPIRLITKAGRVHPARARNIGIANSTADLIVCIDCGTRPTPEYLERVIAPLEQDEADLVGGHVKAEANTLLEAYFSVFYPLTWQLGDPEPRSFPGAAMAFRRELWEDIGGFPEHLLTGEDPEFCRRARKSGARLAFIPEAYIYWRQRRTVRAFCRQYFQYATTRGMFYQANRRRIHISMMAKLLLPIMLVALGVFWWPAFLILGGGVITWTLLNYVRHWRNASLPAQRVVLPLLGLMSEAADLAGFCWGRFRALLRALPPVDQPTQWPEGRQEVFGALAEPGGTATAS